MVELLTQKYIGIGIEIACSTGFS